MRLASQYDVICAGGGISSYLCAALLAKSGIKVLIVDDNASDTNYAEALTLSDLDRSSVFSKILKELEIHDLEKNLLSLDAITQVIHPTCRLVFGQTKEITKSEIKREFLEDQKRVSDFFNYLYQMQDLDSSGLEEALILTETHRSVLRQWKKRLGPIYRAIRETHPVTFRSVFPKKKADEIEKLALALLGSLSYTTPYFLGATQTLRGLVLGMQKRSLLVGGMQGLKTKLLEFIQNHGGHVKYQTTVKSLITTQKKITGALLSSHEGIVEGKAIILGNKLLRTYLTLPEALQKTDVLHQLRQLQPTHWRYTFSIKIPQDRLPVGVTQHMVIISSFERPLEEENFLTVQLKPNQDQKVTLLVTALLPYKASAIKDTYIRIISGRILHALCDVMPFLEQNMIEIDPDFREAAMALKKQYPFNGLDDVPEHLLQYYVQGTKGAQDFWGVSWASSHLNLYFTGRQIWPSLGFTGEALVSKKISDDICRQFPLRWGQS